MITPIRLSQILLAFTSLSSLALAATAVSAGTTTDEAGQTVEERQEPTKAAIIVRNRAAGEFDSQQRVLEDLIAGEITRLGLSVISREDVLESAGTYEGGRSSAAVDTDQLFMDNTSALRLAQNLGADYLLTASILSSDTQDRSFSGYGVKTTNVETTLRLHFRIVGRTEGGSAVSDNIQVSRKESVKNNGISTALLQEAAEEMAKSLEKQLARLPADAEEIPGLVNVIVQATMENLSIPDVVRDENGEYRVSENKYPLAVFGAEVEVNGLTIGATSADTPLQVPAGINKIRLSRPEYDDAVRTVNFFEGQNLIIPMRMSEAGLARLKEMAEFFQAMETDAKLTDAQVSEMEGYAQYLRQSGIRIDYRTDTTEPIQVHQTTNSLFGGSATPAR